MALLINSLKLFQNMYCSDIPASSRKGKVSAANLPSQYALSLMIQSLEVRPKNWNVETPANEWPGVTLNSRSEVDTIIWRNKGLVGIILWKYLPSSIKVFDCGLDAYMSRNRLTGEVDFSLLPGNLEELHLDFNEFYGPVQTNLFPSSLRILELQCNSFSGKIDFTTLPPSMIKINVQHNAALVGTFIKAQSPDFTLFCSGTGITVLSRDW